MDSHTDCDWRKVAVLGMLDVMLRNRRSSFS